MDSGVESFTNMRHFVGVVEDRVDPQQLGRVKVRIYSVHNPDKNEVSIDHLPWAMVLNPITSASMSGVGRSPTGIVEGTWVFGLFLDENEYQLPLVLGTLIGNPTESPTGEGFTDPEGKYPTNDPSKSELGESSVNRHARDETAEDHITLMEKRAAKMSGIESAKGSKVESVLANKGDAFYERTVWDEPHPRFGGQGPLLPGGVPQSVYPMNHVWYTEAGHLFEVDDTPDAERIHWFHIKGTYQEIQPDGNRVTKINGHDYTMILKDNDVYIRGNVNVTVDSDVRMLVKGDMITEVGGNYMLTVGGDYIKKVAGNEAKEILSDQAIQINGNRHERVSKNKNETTIGNYDETVKGTHGEIIFGEENIINANNTTRTTDGVNKAVASNKVGLQSGDAIVFTADNTLAMKSVNDMTISSNTLIDIDAPKYDLDSANGFIDFTQGSIDVTSGNITDTTVTLHSHTHKTTSMDTGDGTNSGQKNTSDSPDANS